LMFKFTFNIGGAGLNPFAAQSEERDGSQQANAPQSMTRKLPPPPRRPIPSSSLLDSEPLSRKRGWTPGLSSPSAAISQPALTNGWLDTPSRYLEAASRSQQNVAEAGLEDGKYFGVPVRAIVRARRGSVAIYCVGATSSVFPCLSLTYLPMSCLELPPAKRRKTLTDSIIGTALSAALIGTAVGMTAYRMWRDRGKATDIPSGESTEQPPPPYEKEEWVDEAVSKLCQPRNKASSPTPRLPRKSRTVTRRTPRRRMVPVIISPARSPIRVQSPSIFAASQSELAGSEQGELDEQMDWMGDKIRELIAEGQKALGKEVVIMGDEPDGADAVDDGLEGWEE
ncbi:hypothetical protein BU17DRAFT_33078, partial [Hysterangium stoloniferum]